MKRITFVGHEASRTGAPKQLQLLLKFIDLHEYDVNVLLLKGGPLEENYGDLYKTKVCGSATRFSGIFEYVKPMRLRRWLKTGHAFLSLHAYKQESPDLFYLSSHSYEFLHTAKALNVPAICHVMEDEISFSLLSDSTLDLLKKYPSHYIAASDAVSSALVKIGIDSNKITVIRCAIDCDEWRNGHIEQNENIRDKLKIPKNAFVISGVGQITPRKGVDLWIQTIIRLKLRQNSKKTTDTACKPIHGIWIGGEEPNEPTYGKLMKQDLERTGLQSCIHFAGEFANPKPYYKTADVMCMSSRQEPFSLAILENLSLGIPVCAFEAAGGTRDLQKKGGLSLATGLDTKSMADCIERLMDTEYRNKQSKIGIMIVNDEYDIRQFAPRVLKIIQDVLS